MIAVEQATAEALLRFPMTLRTRVRWSLPVHSPLDVTTRCAGLTQCERSLGPALGGYVASTLTLTLANHDGALSMEGAAGYLPGGALDALETGVTIEQGPVRPDGTVEYIPVFAGVVDRVRETRGQIEATVVSRLAARTGKATATEYTRAPYVAGPGNVTMATILGALVGSVTVDPEVEAFLDSGWHLDVNIPQRASAGQAAGMLCRSALSTLIETEAGALRAIGEFFPKQMGWGGNFAPRVFDPTNTVGLERSFASPMAASEVIVTYLNGTAAPSYRDTATETRIGQNTKTIDLPYIPFAAQAYWAAYVLQKANAYPDLVSFGLPGLGLLLELNDRIQVRFREGETPLTCRVISKSWTRDLVGVLAIREPGHLLESTFAEWGATSWGSGVLA